MELDLLLFPVAAILVEPAAKSSWFRRPDHAQAAVICEYCDVRDVLLRLPDCWMMVPDARLWGLHDDGDLLEADPRFNGTLGDTGFAVVRHDSESLFVMLMTIGAAEAVLLPKRLFIGHEPFSMCVPGMPDHGRDI
ncbi:hypothetical protein AWB78_04065 [Caballeronia calidae]|uniref:Uncharacterized protein n=1 Tax=Caballeronia calidae TaxID=1777139 RepID=A0A158CKN1_9BURK|nr:hypothetical protein [Caballeronia calidae]SAK82918.1 hypothetical protein AWB78_04065 [Caballeronia calidae]